MRDTWSSRTRPKTPLSGTEEEEVLWWVQLKTSLLIHIRVRVSLGLHSYSMLLNLFPNWQCSLL